MRVMVALTLTRHHDYRMQNLRACFVYEKDETCTDGAVAQQRSKSHTIDCYIDCSRLKAKRLRPGYQGCGPLCNQAVGLSIGVLSCPKPCSIFALNRIFNFFIEYHEINEQIPYVHTCAEM